MLAVMLLCLPVLSVQAESVTEDNNKSSFQSYAGQGHLTYTEETVLSFDSMDQFYQTWKGHIDTSDKKEGSGSLSVDLSTENPPESFKPNCFETKDRTFKTTVTDFRKQTFKFWVYVNDIDLLVCDHDSVHDTPQKGSGTLYITLAKDSSKKDELFVMHTIEGSGWHLVEFDLNVSRDFIKFIDREKPLEIGCFKIYVEALPGLKMKFDDLKKVTYKNDGYKAPQLENNGRWISTCDFDAVDGAIVSEWYGSSFDTKEKVQGSSSLQITGRQIHEDYRVVWSGMNTPCKWQNDVLHFDFYMDDPEVLGTHFEQRMQLADLEKNCDCECWFYYTYDHLNRYSNGGEGLKEGWNSIDIPCTALKRENKLTKSHSSTSHNWSIVFNLMYWKGAKSDDYYTIRYDNMYLYERDTSALNGSANANLDKKPATSLGPKDQPEEEDNSSSIDAAVVVGISVGAAVVVGAVVTTVILVTKKKKTVSKKPSSKPKDPPENN